jgi:hypothetical protein
MATLLLCICSRVIDICFNINILLCQKARYIVFFPSLGIVLCEVCCKIASQERAIHGLYWLMWLIPLNVKKAWYCKVTFSCKKPVHGEERCRVQCIGENRYCGLGLGYEYLTEFCLHLLDWTTYFSVDWPTVYPRQVKQFCGVCNSWCKNLSQGVFFQQGHNLKVF